jgi:double-stranded uracil-DNA glycosylase
MRLYRGYSTRPLQKSRWRHYNFAMSMKPHRPTRAELQAAAGRTVPDVIGRGLGVLFCGINPGLYSAAVEHHFARPGNRFWPALHRAGFTDRLLDPSEERHLLELGYGITNIVARATAAAGELSADELQQGGRQLTAKVRKYAPRYLAILGIGAFRQAFSRPHAATGPQDLRIGDTRVWVLPNPSGLNAHYSLNGLVAQFRELRDALNAHRGS